VGSPAPNFTLPDIQGESHSLSDFAGKVVVLEWVNRDCPFVKKHYEPKNMQSLQATYTAKGVVWLTVCSSAPGKQGHFSAEEWKQIVADQGFQSTAVLLDPAGDVGRAYEAKTTPHLFVIDADGILRYDGAIDDKPSTNSADIPGARPYLAEAVDAVLAGEAVATSKTTPYGCSVKY
jgi:peroxiredoxin